MPTVLPTRRRIADEPIASLYLGVYLLLPFFVALLLSATAVGHGQLSLVSLGEALAESHNCGALLTADVHECTLLIGP